MPKNICVPQKKKTKKNILKFLLVSLTKNFPHSNLRTQFFFSCIDVILMKAILKPYEYDSKYVQ